MLTDDDWQNLPDDPELAFLVFDDCLWAKVENARTPTRHPMQEEPDPVDSAIMYLTNATRTPSQG